jgi:hypothetical protein
MALSSWSDGHENFSYPQNGPVSPVASVAGLSAGVAVGYHHGCQWPTSDHGDEASRSLDFDYALPVTANTVLPGFVPFDLQYTFPTYQASPVRLSVIRVYINVS